MASRHVLSKSTYLRGVQCEKSLYLYKHYYNLRDELTPEKKAIFSRGTNVGVLAQDLFPGGTDASPKDVFHFAESADYTQQLLQEGETVIYEAAFIYDGVLAALDILVKQEGKWRAYEVKSSTKVSDVYLRDAALQYWVITNSGIELEDIFIVHIDNTYIKQGAIDVEGLFKKVSVKDEVLKRQKEIPENVQRFKEVIRKPATPDVPIGPHCFDPYPCDFMGTCWKGVPENSVFDISGMHKQEQFEMYEQGMVKISDIPDDYSLRKNQKIQVEQAKKSEVLIKKGEIKNFLNGLKYPLWFFDLETFMPAVPIFDGTHPYEHIPFQYSLHVKEQEVGEVKHFEFLAEAGQDPRKAFAENLLKHIGKEGSVLVYNQQFERSVLNSLARKFPEYVEEIRQINSRLVDLMVPFKNKWYYHPDMKGSYSIKAVLPALVPELNHKDLDISGGSMAMVAFEKLQTETDIFKIAEMRDNLLEYCKLDTLAMVEILEVLYQEVTE